MRSSFWPAAGWLAGSALTLAGIAGCSSSSAIGAREAAPSQPLVIGETFLIRSEALGESRRINVFVPTIYGEPIEGPLPVLYMPDGGTGEDFLHIAGLVEVLSCNGGMRPHILVGIENTQRRRDLTGPTSNPQDREIAPVVGGSEAFRRFIRDELVPSVRARYPTTDDAAIVGESLAGLFVVETFFREPDLFNTYIAIDPSLWWDNASLVSAAESAPRPPAPGKRLFLASSDEPEISDLTSRLAGALPASTVLCRPMPQESHATIYHPAALAAFRAFLAD